MADIARIEPAIAQCVRRLRRRFPVAGHNLRASDNDLAIFAHRQLALACFDIDDLLLGVVDRHADAIQAHKSWIARLRMRQRRCLRHAIALDDLQTGFLL